MGVNGIISTSVMTRPRKPIGSETKLVENMAKFYLNGKSLFNRSELVGRLVLSIVLTPETTLTAAFDVIYE